MFKLCILADCYFIISGRLHQKQFRTWFGEMAKTGNVKVVFLKSVTVL